VGTELVSRWTAASSRSRTRTAGPTSKPTSGAMIKSRSTAAAILPPSELGTTLGPHAVHPPGQPACRRT